MTAEVLARKVAKVMDKLQRIAEVGPGSLDQLKPRLREFIAAVQRFKGAA